eukprot:4883879-Alexandrium_andersonii.AAC.1
MSASLVGSEMCIRDRRVAAGPALRLPDAQAQPLVGGHVQDAEAARTLDTGWRPRHRPRSG